jgi:hypothetical protein
LAAENKGIGAGRWQKARHAPGSQRPMLPAARDGPVTGAVSSAGQAVHRPRFALRRSALVRPRSDAYSAPIDEPQAEPQTANRVAQTWVQPSHPSTRKAIMNTSLTTRLSSFGAAALLTFAMLVGVNSLAVSDAPAGAMARSTATVQA